LWARTLSGSILLLRCPNCYCWATEDAVGDAVPAIIQSQGDEKIFQKYWARLVQKIYEGDPCSAQCFSELWVVR
jgi:hypothetical protein